MFELFSTLHSYMNVMQYDMFKIYMQLLLRIQTDMQRSCDIEVSIPFDLVYWRQFPLFCYREYTKSRSLKRGYCHYVFQNPPFIYSNTLSSLISLTHTHSKSE